MAANLTTSNAGATYVPIATIVSSGTGSTATFSNIPQTYTDLVIVVNGTIATGLAALAYEFNADANAANYSYTRLQGDGTTATSTRVTSDAAIGFIAQTASMNIINIMNYSNSTTYKTSINRANSMYASDARTAAYVSLWRNTAAITSVTLKASSNFSSGTTFNLFGIRSA